MPVQVNEIVIRATIVEAEGQAAAGAPSGGSSAGNQSADERTALVSEIAEQVLEILRKENKR